MIYRENDGGILYTNKYFDKAFNVSDVLAANTKIDTFLADPGDISSLYGKGNHASFRDTGFIGNNEIHVKKANGVLFTSIVSAAKILYDGERAVITSFDDITYRKRLEKEILEISGREQQRIGQDLHVGVGQLLAGIGYMCKFLEGKLKKKGWEEEKDAREIAELVSQTIS